ncbi:forespore capture DNA-binding protein RefZ [Aeribacillus alveayuensis]|uniref:AcrR family transcriptional regulator n=1 Tax=Aeribacillus alveayuensis TaxID=279215 RepID=A0ABT9VJ98_9BACI|nr:AcrR family transcriptional regulator [Bacillus alveayuensis]
MSKNSSLTKQKIIDASIFLFNSKGYSGTSVREIAKKANVNVAHISYYFKGKGGLLEFLVSQFYERYLSIIENNFHQIECLSAKSCLKQMIWDILNYQHENRQLARVVYREITIDSVLIREVMTTYLTKEKYFLRFVLEKGRDDGEFNPFSISHMIIQLKSLLNMPFLQPQYISEVLHIQLFDDYFVKQYFQEIISWLEQALFKQKVEKVAL